MPASKRVKLCVGASSGGHMTELLGLLSTVDSWPAKPDVYVTTRQIWAQKLTEMGPTYVVGECDRNKPAAMLITGLKSLYFVLKERPTVILTTGSLPIAIVCLVGKMLLRSKLIWIDSIAQIDDLSMSGKLVLKHADLFLTQWPDVAAKYDKARYVGQLQ